ncbi:MAG TPA: hypothetical protein VMU51_14225 [Mycobacteriales bacterium]|nr:hypothetical protein [Mycobacteriales bacterium]
MATLREEREREAGEQRKLRIRVAVAVVVLLAGVAGVGLLAGGRPVKPGRGTFQPASADPVQAAVPVLAGYVEQARGLLFKTKPVVTVVDAAAFAKIVAEPLTGVGAANRQATAQALGLAHPGGAGTADVEAFYSYPRRQVVLRDDMKFDAFGRVVLAHELAHALADQNFDLLAMTKAAAVNSDRLRALDALIEGDATRLELAYLGTQSRADQADVHRRYNYDPVPASFADNTRLFPYTVGRDFVTAVAEAGGNPALDAAFRRPPTSTAQIIDPRKYLGGVLPIGVRAPAAEGTTVDQGSLGQFGLALLISHGRRVANVSATSQWVGDSYVTFRSGRGFCTYDNVVMNTSAARDQLFTDLAPLAQIPANRTRITKSSERGVRLQACT